MNLLQNTLRFFRKPAPPPPASLQSAAVDERIGGSRSKRARIRDVLRRFEQGGFKEPEAVEEILKILR